jgi:integrase
VVNRQNYQWVKDHLRFLEEVHLLAPASLRRYWFYLRHLLLWADKILLPKSPAVRPTFPAYVASLRGKDGIIPLAPATQKKIVNTARRFFLWAHNSRHKGLRRLSINWIETLRPARLPQPAGDHHYVTLEEVHQLATHPVDPDDLALRRDQAAAAMLFLSGARASAFATLPIEAVKIGQRTLHQWPELGVKTKNGKRASTFLLPISELLKVIVNWDTFVRTRQPVLSPWYAPVKTAWGEQQLSPSEPGQYRSQALNKRLRVLYKAVGLPYKSAHKFRHGHAVYGLQHANTMADYKAVSMNLMHANLQVTDGIYAVLLSTEVQARIAALQGPAPKHPEDHLAQIFTNMTTEDLTQALRIIADRLAA